MLCVGDWQVNPASGEISRGGETARLDERPMRLLLYLADRAGEVVSIEELLNHVWAGVTVTSDSVYQAVTSLRRQLGDDPKQPKYIATVPRLGYRMVAAVTSRAAEEPVRKTSIGRMIGSIIAAALCLGLIAAIVLQRKAEVLRKSIAVLPFLDLTEGMKEETFADGMTEELIGRLSKISGLRVPAPTSSFYFKGKQLPVADIARSLGVAYILDGSVRKSGIRLRVAARLLQADNGYVIWTETYDRPFDDILTVQDDIAVEVTKALKASGRL